MHDLTATDRGNLHLSDLRGLARWVAWRTEHGERPGKLVKTPYRPSKAGGPAKVNDATTWGTFEQAREQADRLLCVDDLPKGIGIVLGSVDRDVAIGGVDLDSCAGGGTVAPWASRIIERLDSYAEVSPSGTGVKVFFKYAPDDLPVIRAALNRQPEEGTSRKWAWPGGNHPPAIELYLDSRYFAVTEQHHPSTPGELRSVPRDTLLWLINEAGPAFKAAAPAADGDRPAQGDESRSAVAFRLAAELRRAGTVTTFEQMCAALRADARTAEWCREKGAGRGDRELRRIWDKTEPDGVDALIAEFNARFMVVLEAGKTVIYRPAFDPVLNRRAHWRMSFGDFRNAYLNRRVAVNTDAEGKPIYKKAAEVWLAHPARRQYLGGVVFDPSGRHAEPDALNLWQGFAVDPRPGSWARMQDHIRTIICRGDPDRFEYLMGWLARLVQRPDQQGEVAIVMKGLEGTGKGTLARAMMRLLGQHALAISNSKHLTGNFNAHLRDCVFLFADEAFFAGDKQHVGVLKSLITEPHLTIEGKYQNAVQTPNFLHMMLASNEEWVIPASLEARRFLMLEVADGRKNDTAYFGAIWEEMEAGGYAAMLHSLLAYDLTRFNVFAFPRTAELGEQKKLSLDTTHRWWVEVLQRGYVFESRCGLSDTFTEWMPEVTTELLYRSYLAFADRQRERHPISRESLGRFMREIGGQSDRMVNGVIGEELARVADDTGMMVTRGRTITKARAGCYVLGDLEGARAAFSAATGLPINWEHPAEGRVVSEDDDAPPF